MIKQKKRGIVVVARWFLDLVTAFVFLVMGKSKPKLKRFPCQVYVPKLIPKAYKVIEDVEPTQFDPSKLIFSSFQPERSGGCEGDVMRKQAKDTKANLGLSDAPALLGKYKKGLKTITAKLCENDCIVLTGTLLQRSDGSQYGSLYVPVLLWRDGRLKLHFRWLSCGWDESHLLVSYEQALVASNPRN